MQDQRIADIESRMVKTDLAGVDASRSTTVTFLDKTTWLIVTGMPENPRPTKKLLGMSYRARAGESDRVVRVIDDRNGRVFAEARWPDRRAQKQKLRESLDLDGSGVLQRILESVPLLVAPPASQVTVGDETQWLLPVKIPGRFHYAMRLGHSLTILANRNGKETKLIPDAPVALEAALLSWQIAVGDIHVKQATGGG